MPGGCAGSANHEVISPYRAGDETLTCVQLDAEITRTQAIIDGVSQDNADLGGADVIDGLLFFPFNPIAKSGNYKAAVDAAGKRIGMRIRREMRHDNGQRPGSVLEKARRHPPPGDDHGLSAWRAPSVERKPVSSLWRARPGARRRRPE